MIDMVAKAEEVLETVQNMELLLKRIKEGLEAKSLNIFDPEFEKNIELAYRSLSFAAPHEE